VDGQSYATSEEYYDQAVSLVESTPAADDQAEENEDWMPLGVFAITGDEVNAANMYLQLAVRKDGAIGGTFYNKTTGVDHPLEGMVDQSTQRACWMAADGSNTDIVMEAGIFNLTKDKAEALIHFGPDQTQTVTLVRMDEPAESGEATDL